MTETAAVLYFVLSFVDASRNWVIARCLCLSRSNTTTNYMFHDHAPGAALSLDHHGYHGSRQDDGWAVCRPETLLTLSNGVWCV